MRRYSPEEKAGAVRMVGRCGPSWGPSMGRQRGLPRSWVTGSSPSGRGSSRPISMTV